MSAAENLSLHDFVKTELGADVLDKLIHQSTGGDNNNKGNKYEQFFAVYKLAKYYSEKPDDDIEISSQDVGFVDDLTVRNKTDSSKKNYQLKDSKSVYWSNRRGIKPYFKRQHAIDLQFYRVDETEMILVLAQKDVYDRRSKDVPNDISSYTRCMYFPNPDTVNELLLESKEFKEAMGKLCPWPDETDKLEVVTQQLLGAWAAHSKTVRSVNELIERAKAGADPNFFQVPHSTLTLDENVTSTLDEIDKLRYEVKGGYLNYSLGGLSGFVGHKLGTPEFQGICDEIISQKPADAMALIAILVGNGDRA